MQIQQLSVFIENKPGRLAEITEVLAEAGIDIRAISVADTSDFGILRVIVDKPKEAVAALKPVSYTHLDVYKRQATHIPRAWGQIPPGSPI